MTTEKIQDIYPLSPMQAGILFETLYAPETGAYLDQHVYRIGSSLQIEQFEKAWQHVCDRHAILRTSFHWEKLDEPLQIVHTDAEIPIERLDWSAVAEKDLAAKISDFLKEDRKKGVDLNQAPLMRLILIATSQKDWIVVWSCHHLLLDRWSVPIVLSDLRTTYDTLCEGRRVNLPRVRQYGEYIGWLQDQDAQKAESYWKGRLSGITSPTTLPMDRSAGSLAGGDMPAREVVQVEEEMTMALQNMARQNHLTINTVVQGAWALLLSRYSGSEDVLFGATVSGRPASLTGVESIVGLFINSLPVRVRVPENEPLVPWLLQLQEEMAETREYEYSSAVQIQGASDIPRGIPLFESLVVVQNIRVSHGGQPGKPAGLEMQPYGGEFWRGSSLNFMATPGRELRLTVSYDAARYDPADIARMLGHIRTILAGMAQNADRTVGSLPMLTEAELEEQLVDFNDTCAPYPDQKCVHQLFEEQVERAPEAVAIQFGDQTLTYGELDKRANQLAHHLKTLGVGPDMLVGLCVRRSVEMVIGLFGILKAGGAYLPLDPSYPMERLAFMISDAQVPLLVTQESCVDVLPSYWAQVICLDTEWDMIARESEDKPACDAHPDNLAYMIYTSGSTGQPKGVMVPHRGAVNYLTWASKNYNVAEGSGTLVDTPIGFDLTVTSLLSPLTVGQKATLIAEDQGVEGLAEAINRAQDVTLVKTTPAHMEILRGLVRPEQASVVKLFVIGGEALRKDTLSFWQTHAPATRHVNEYGPTETVVGCCIYEAGKEDSTGSSVPIGQPIANARLYLLDTYLRPVPKGVPGELYIGGTGVVRGYINRPDVTAERFIPDSFGGVAGARLYRTGDLCRFLPDGNLEYLGRADHQVKVRGYRIELGEIESVLLQYVSVRDAVVLAREDQPGDKRLVAYVVATEAEPNVSTLREHLRSKLPEYMVPPAFVFLESLPLSSNGKVDRKALPMPGAVDTGQDAYVAPRTPTEETLAGIWREILRVERVGANDNFFELGGHSLLAMQVISRVREALEVELPLRDLFEAPVLSDLAGRVEGLLGNGEFEALSIVRVSRDEPLPLSFAQQRLWFLYHLEPTSTMYNVSSGMRIRGPLNVPALEHSLTEILRRHEPLRTVFQSTDGEAVQVIRVGDGPVLSRVDLRLIADEDRAVEARKLQAEEAQTPFDLTKGPLFRAKLILLDDEEHILLLTMHHIVSDGWSYAILIREMGELYNGYCANKPVELPELPIQYADFAAWQKEWLSGENLERQIAHWKEHLGGAPALLTLPTDRPRPSVQSFRGARKGISLSKELTHALRDFGQSEGATLFMTTLAAYNVLLSRYTGQEDIVIGSATAGRTRSEVEGLVGFFLNTLALRTVLSGAPSFRELLGRVKETALGAFAHQDLPFEKLVEELQPERSLSHAPIFQATFQLQNLRRTAYNFEGLRAESLLAEGVTAKYDLGMTVAESPDQMQVFVEYNTDLFDSGRIDSLLAHYRTLLESIVASPDEKIAHLPILTQTEKQHLLEDWNGAKAEFPRDRCIHELFETWVEKTPAATALIFEGEEVSYQELNSRANQLAHYLQMMGVGPDMIVGLCIERSVEMIVGLLGILKAGAGYLPLDTGYPIDRLSFMMQDAQVPVVVAMEASANQLPTHWAQVVCLDADADMIAAQSEDNPQTGVSPNNLAYVIYTSGSTGQPKGVLVPHRGLLNVVTAQQSAFGVNSSDRVLQFASLNFDASAFEIVMALGNGASLALGRRETLLPGPDLARFLSEKKVSVVTLPPSALALTPVDKLSALRTITVAGEACSSELVSRCAPGRAFFNLYGPTEATIWGSYAQCHEGMEKPPIGVPIVNSTAYILDNALQPVPVGVPGELYIGGAGVTRGYLHRPDLTAEKFVPDQFSSEPGARLYRSGDLCRWQPDGQMEFVDRIDHQVKIRGFRVEPGEIESALLDHPAVREAVVIVREDEPGIKRLVAYVTSSEGASDSAALREHLRSRLPDYMIPAAFVVLDVMPLSPSGKINRAVLPAPDGARSDMERIYTEPSTDVERALAAIWQEVLRLDQVGIHDNFFELGGDSILSIQLVSRAQRDGISITPKQIFEHQTVAQLASVAGTADAVVAEQGRVSGKVPLTPIQKLFFEHFQTDPHHYNNSQLLALHKRYESGVMQQAIARLVDHHDALRLRFQKTKSGWTQANAAHEDNEFFEWIDLSQLSEEEQMKRVGVEADRLQASLNLEAGPIVRAAYFDLGEKAKGLLLFIIHHLAVDGVSWRVLLEDLESLLRQSEDKAAELHLKTTSFQEWAKRIEEHASSADLAAEADYWLSAHKARVEDLPVDKPGGRNDNQSVARHLVRLDAEDTTALLQEVPAIYHTQINDVLLTALAQTIARWTKRDAVLVEMEGHGREDLFADVDISRTVGWFTSVYPVSLQVRPDEEVGAALKSVKEQLRRIPNRGIGYGILRYSENSPVRDKLASMREPQIVFNYLGQFGGTYSEDGLFSRARGSQGARQSAKQERQFLLEINSSVASNKLEVQWNYSQELFERATIERLGEEFIEAIRAIIAHCRTSDAGGYTPSDLSKVKINQKALDRIVGKLRQS